MLFHILTVMSRKLRWKEVALVTGRNRAWFIIMDKVVPRCCSHRKNAREGRNNKNVAKNTLCKYTSSESAS